MKLLLQLVAVCAVLSLAAAASPHSKRSTPIPTMWSQELGLRYVYFSYAAYCPTSSIQNWSCKWCSTNETSGFKPTFQAHSVTTDMRGFGGYYPTYDTIIVSFRGSSSIRNWIEDLENIRSEPYKNSTTMRIGDGWWNAYLSIRKEVLNGVAALVAQHPTSPIAVTGHSLGAAVAATCALDLVESGYPNTYLYDYGEPRVGNADYASYAAQQIKAYFRVVNGDDIVPTLPYQALGFKHSPTEVWEDPAASLNFKVCSSTDGEDRHCEPRITLSTADHLTYFGIHESC
eukprot:TRINITY_DN6707_c0_g1_i1.p1 TRINITY_DN6707_c0_g1~~TRINITY_DN6707_c0_g1_i1.p1  ORF type:complete len:287 (-),score=89.98 TRINITY_DN6707_c0_g1_i1:346-1206(-)